jgi:hypothetical protein
MVEIKIEREFYKEDKKIQMSEKNLVYDLLYHQSLSPDEK